jgi:hypothetical protein
MLIELALMAQILLIELVVMTKVFGQNVLYFTRVNVYKPWLNEEREGEEEVVQSKGAKKNWHHGTLFQTCM